jgi:hypothetical protein
MSDATRGSLLSRPANTASAVILSRGKIRTRANCRRDEQLQIGVGAQLFEIDKALDQILQWIDVERIYIIRRKITRQCSDDLFLVRVPKFEAAVKKRGED